MQAPVDSTHVRLEIQKLNDLPAMSLVVHQFLEAIQDNDMEVRQLASIIERDPGLLGRIIGLANSAYFGHHEKVVTAEDAIFKVLGLNTAKSLALSIVLAGAFDANRCPRFQLDNYWSHAMSVAILAQRLAPHVKTTPRPGLGESYLAGLLHSIGLLALVHIYPREMSKVFTSSARATPLALIAAEREFAGTDHCQVGGWLARKWHLPAEIVFVIEHHMDGANANVRHPLIFLISQVAQWVSAALHAETTPPPPDLISLGIEPEHAQRVFDSLAEKRTEILSLSRTLAHG